MEVSMPTLLRSLFPRRRQARKSKLGLKVRKSSIRVSSRSLFVGLLVLVLVLSTQPVSVWASAASAVKESVAPISSRIKPSEVISGISDWVKELRRSKPSKPAAYDKSASRLRVHGHKIRMSVGTQQQVTALAVDDNESPVDGAQFRWTSSNTEVASVDETGIVKAVSVGHTDITATSGILQESFRVHVQEHAIDDPIPDPRDIIPSKQEGGTARNSGKRYKYRTASYKTGGSRSSAPYVMLPDDASPAVQTSPGYNVGTPPYAPVTSGGGTVVNPMSSNFSKVIPIVGLGGRGDVSVMLSMVINSQVWTYDPSTSAPYQYNVNRDWPGPGFSMGFGKLNSQSGTFLYIGPDGTRHPMQTVATNTYETTDGTFVRVKLESSVYNAYFPNGIRITYDSLGPDDYLYASRVQDRNGNFFTITYGTAAPMITQITDSLNRTIIFNYVSGKLDNITAPDQTSGGNGGRRTVAYFVYQTSATTLAPNFGSSSVVLNGVDSSGCACVTLLRKIYFPATGTGYVFTTKDADGDDAYGLITRVTQKNNMHSNDDGDDVAYVDFNYPTKSTSALTDIPRFTIREEKWKGINTSSSVPVKYSYSTSSDSTYNIYTVQGPYTSTVDGRKIVQKTPISGTYNGVIKIDEVQDSSGAAQSRTTYSWNTDSSSSSPQVSTITHEDVPASLSKHTEYVYPGSGATFNNPTQIKEYGFSNELLRKAVYTYVTDSNYISPSTAKPRLLNLPASVTLYEGTSSTALARTEYSYDGTSTDDTGSVKVGTAGHNSTDFPTTFNYRGNRTAVKQYPDYAASTGNYTEYVATYDVLGNILTASLSCCQQKTFTYGATEYYAWPVTVQAGSSPSLTDTYTYEFGTGNVKSHTDPNSREVDYTYNVGDLRLSSTILPTHAHIDTAYDDVNLKTTQTTYQTSGNSLSDQKAQQETDYDGLGHVLTSKQWVGGTSFNQVDNLYDTSGRLVSQSNPHDSGASASLFTVVTYDDLDRTKNVELPLTHTGDTDAQRSIKYDYYGRYSMMTDEVGRQKITAADALGRTSQVIEVATNASEYMSYSSITVPTSMGSSVYGYTTTYTYNALDNLTTINQGAQTRSFVYDGLGRLLYESQPEQVSNISYNSHNYSKKYEYDPLSSQHVNSNLRRVTDSRGDVKTLYYDGLNRVIACRYSGSNTASDFYYFWDSSTSISVAANDFDSNSAFSKSTTRPSGFSSSNSAGRLMAMVNDGSTKGEYFEYGSDGQVTKHLERIYDGSSSTDFTTQSAYNSLLMPTSMTYPSGRSISYSYDDVNRLTGITDNWTSETYASGITYTNAGQVESFYIGNTSGHRKESYTYNDRLQLATQKVQVGTSTPLLDLTYSYAGNSGDHGAGTGAGNSGQLIGMTDNQDSTKSVSYTYDLLGRLKTAQTPSGWSVKETYDRYGNRWQQDRVGNSTTLPASGSGTVTISGSEQSDTEQVQDYCQLYGDEGCLEWHYSWVTTYDSGPVSVTVGGYTANVWYGVGSTPSTIASALASQFNSDPSSTVTASVSGATLTLTAKAVGSASNYTVSTSSDTYDPGTFGSASFSASGSNLTGGATGTLGSGGTGPQSNLSFDLNNHINTSSYTYDNAGNLTADPTYAYTYDGENRQTQVYDGSVTTTYGYNSNRQRMIRTSGGVSTF